jgi:hypothetical protein
MSRKYSVPIPSISVILPLFCNMVVFVAMTTDLIVSFTQQNPCIFRSVFLQIFRGINVVISEDNL